MDWIDMAQDWIDMAQDWIDMAQFGITSSASLFFNI
jgi:hypothetical protein